MYNIINNIKNYEDIIDKIKNNTIKYKNYYKI